MNNYAVNHINLNFFNEIDFSLKSVLKTNSYEEDILFVLRIPRINLVEKVYTMNSSLNDVDIHVQILEGSIVDKNFIFLAAHSGNGSNSYFNRLIELKQGEVIYINKSNEEKQFVVESLFYIEKDGYFEYSSLENANILYLITCSLNDNSKQLIVKARLLD